MVNVAINGFGRIGRMVFRAGFDRLNFVAINDLGDPALLAHLLKYDSVQGQLTEDIQHTDHSLIVKGKEIPVYKERDPANIPWKNHDVDVVMECTGFFTKRELAEHHLKGGAKKVIISAPSPDADFVIVKGVNEHNYDKEKHHIISNGSCTTNCLAPMVKVLHDNFSVLQGFMTTVHAYTGDQMLLDAAAAHKDWRRARAAGINLVPTSTGAAIAVTQVIPELHGKLDGMAIRAPVPCGSITDFTCKVNNHVSKEDVNRLFANVAGSHLLGILEYTEKPIVSTDIIGNTHSVIFDSALTKVIEGTFVKVVGWYDNEWGYSNRMVDVAELLFI